MQTQRGEESEEELASLTGLVIGAAIEVHRHTGPGLLESVYQKCLEHELRLRRIPAQPQCRVPVMYKGHSVGDDMVMDLFFPGQLVVELKAVEKMIPLYEAQLLTYMKLNGVRLGLLINFNVVTLRQGVKRMIL